MDAWYAQRMKDVATNPQKFPDYRIHKSLLYEHRPHTIDPLTPDLKSWKLVVPLSQREQVLYDAHDSPQAGFGEQKTCQRLSLIYYWPKMRKEAIQYVKKCTEC